MKGRQKENKRVASSLLLLQEFYVSISSGPNIITNATPTAVLSRNPVKALFMTVAQNLTLSGPPHTAESKVTLLKEVHWLVGHLCVYPTLIHLYTES